MYKQPKRNWLERLVIQHSRPIPVNTAQKWRTRLSIAYLFFAWNLAGIVIYNAYDKYWSNLKSENLWPSKSDATNLRKIRVSGLTVVENELIAKNKGNEMT